MNNFLKPLSRAIIVSSIVASFLVPPLSYNQTLNTLLGKLSGTLEAQVGGGLVGAWSFNENSGTSATDASGNGNTASFVGSPTWATGKNGSGISFNRTSTLNAGSGAVLDDLAPTTISFWVNPRTLDSNTDIFLGKPNSFATGATVIHVDSASNRRIGFWDDWTGGDVTANFTQALTLNTWQHITFTWNGQNNGTGTDVKLYIDGMERAVTTFTGGGSNVYSNAAANLAIGPFDGVMDDLRIYNRVLSQSEIQTDMNTSVGSTTTPPPSDTTAPSTPTNLSATAVSTSQINLSWSASSDNVGVTGYNIYRNNTQIASVANTSYSDTGLTASTLYTYYVRATDSAGNLSASSASVSATTQGTVTAPTISLSASPTSVTSGSGATLSWSSTNATSCSASGAWSGAKATSGSQTLTNLTTTGTYTLSCTGSGGTTSQSTTITVTSAPPPPTSGIFYISPSGSDTNSGTSTAAPFRTFAKGISMMSTGNTLRLMDGTYTDSVTGVKANTIIEALNDGKAKITGAFNPGNAGFEMRGIVVQSSGEKTLGSGNTYRRMSFVGGPSCGNNVNSLAGSNTKVYESAFYGAGGRYLYLAYQASGVVLEDVILRPDGGWGSGSSTCTGFEPHAGYNMYDTEGFTVTRAILVDAISTAHSSSENIGGQVVNTHQSHANVGTINQSVITMSGDYGRFSADGLGSNSHSIIDSVSKGNGYTWGLTRNVTGVTTATRFDTDAQIGQFKGSISRTSGANLVLNASFLNDARWKSEMCSGVGITRGFCGTSMNLGDYVASNIGTTPPPPTPAPTISLSASPTSVTSGSGATLSWSSTNATSCSASGAWSGAKATSGSQTLTNLTTTGTYTLSCTGSGGTTSQSTTITVTSAPPPPTSGIFYISPSGSDTNSGTTSGTPFKTFAKAFSTMTGGSELILLNGVYGEAQGTGYISYLGTGSAQPPSGTSSSNPTIVRALNPGSVTVNGGLFIGRSTRKDSYIKIQGITFEGGGSLYNTNYVTVKDSGFHGSFSVGTNDHSNGNTNNLIEDVWVWASGSRIIAINYRADRNVWRRVIIRGDGCGTTGCSGSGNPNVGVTVYNSRDVSFQNVIVADRILSGTDSPYGDFATAQHDPGGGLPPAADYFGRNEWLGPMSVNSPDTAFYFEADNVLTGEPSWTIRNAVAIRPSGAGINMGLPYNGTTPNIIDGVTVVGAGSDGIRVAPGQSGSTVRNIISANSGRYGINSASTPAYVDVYNSTGGAYNQTTCSTGCRTTNPQGDGGIPSLLYPVRIEQGSTLKGAGLSGADIGANIVTRYGIDGTRFGDAGYNTPIGTNLWPWPNEARIKAEMCANTTRGFCSTGKRLDGVNNVTLTSYVWESLGNTIPSSVYIGTTPPPPTPAPTISLSASATSVTSGSGATLSWSSTNATSCSASGAWSGAKSTSGSQTLTNLTTTGTYTLSCTGSGGTTSQSTTITVTSAPPPTGGELWVDGVSGNNANSGTQGSPFKTIAYGISRLQSGGTLVVKNGTYNESISGMVSGVSSAQPTTVRAETPMDVRINGGFTISGQYIKIDGFVFSSTAANIGRISGDYNRLTRSIIKGVSGSAGQYGHLLYVGGNNNLVEDVAGVGGCRYCFEAAGPDATSKNNIYRRVVGRFDYSTSPLPKSTFNTYGNNGSAAAVSEHYYQNVIAVDGQRPSTGGEDKYGAFYHPKSASLMSHYGVIVLNEDYAYYGVDCDWGDSTKTPRCGSVTQSVVWDSGSATDPNFSRSAVTTGGIGNTTSSGNLLNNTGGATIMKRFGVSGTLWGEPGYDQLTNEDLWPWPYEAKIKAVFAETNNPPTGATPTTNNTKRGFAADGNGLYGGPITLTSYIWEYLGNPCPSNICTGGTTTPAPTISLSASPTSVTSGSGATLSWSSTNATSCTASGAWSGTKATSGSQTLTNLTATGTYTLSCTGSGGTTAQSVSINITGTTPPASTKFSLNDRVEVQSGPLNVRATASATGTLLGSQATGNLGTVIGGPVSANGFNWWNINYDTGADGWSAEDYLVKYTTTTPPPSTNCSATSVRCVDDTPGATQEYSTIQAAATAAVAGDTVLVHDGTYAGFQVTRSGTSANPIVFKANGSNVLINTPTSTSDGVFLSNVSYVTIEGFRIQNMPQRCISARNGSPTAPMQGLLIKNNYCSGAGHEGLYLSQVGNSLVEGNTVVGSSANGVARGHGIYLANAGSDGTTIRGNTIYQATASESNGIHFNGDLSVGGDGIVSNLVVEKNIIYANGQSGLNMDGVQSSLVQNNVIYGNTRHALRAYAIDGAQGPRNLTIINNTFITGSSGWPIKLSEDLGGHKFFNNILLGPGSIVVGNANFTSNNNILSNSFSLNEEASTMSLTQWQGGGYDTNSIVSSASALFTNAAANNYTLLSTAPAIGRGVATFGGTPAPTTDIVNNARPQGGSYDAGAYEYASGTTTPPPPPQADITAPSQPGNLSATAVSSSQINLSWTASTDNIGVTGYDIYRNNTFLTTVTGTSYSNTGLTSNTTYSYYVRAKDAAGNQSTPSTTVSATTLLASDTTLPSVSITSPASGTTVSGTVTVSGSALDPVIAGQISTGITGVQFKLDGANLGAEDTTSPYSVSWNTTSATNGTHTLTAVARDAAGNQATAGTVTVTVNNVVAPSPDTTAPSTPISVTGTAVSSSQVNLSWSASMDPVVSGQVTSGIANYQVFRCTGTTCTPTAQIATATSNSFNNTGLSANTTYRYRLRAVDVATNVSAYSSIVTVTTQAAPSPTDTTLPTVSMGSPASNATVSGTITVSASATDNVGITGVQFKLDGANLGAEDTTSPYSVSWNTTSATNGTHTLTAVARDAAGNQATANTRTVTVSNAVPDTIKPIVTITTPTNGTTYTTVSPSVTLAGSASDNIGVTQVSWDSTQGAQGTAMGTTNWTTTITLQSGANTITVTVRDQAGNTNTDTITITYTPAVSDTTKPSTPQNITAASVSTSQITLTWTASTDNVGVTGYRVIANGTLIANITETTHIHTNLSPSTSYTYTVEAIDAAGNTSLPGSAFTATTATAPAPQPPTSGGGGGGGGSASSGSTSSGTGTSSAGVVTSPQTSTTTTPPQTGTIAPPPTTTPTVPSQTLATLTGPFSIGMRSDQVKLLQEMLIKDGVLTSEATGYYGTLTTQAVQKFQTKYGIVTSGTPSTTGYGLAGPGTRAKLNTLYAGTSGGGTSLSDREALIASLRKQVADLTAILQTLIAKLAALKAEQGVQ